MSWLVQPRLVNGPFDDPGLYLDFRFGRRAILFDLGDLAPLSSRELMRVSHAFVSHTHVDHFAGFDQLLRVCLHRPGPLHLLGPPGFIDRVDHRLQGFTWNLIDETSVDFQIHVGEFWEDRIARKAVFPARQVFMRQDAEISDLPQHVVLSEDDFHIEAVSLDHGIPSLAFALRETQRVNVRRGVLERLGFPKGPWLNRAKSLIRAGTGDADLDIPGIGQISLRDVPEKLFFVGPGQSIAYVTDTAFSEENRDKILFLARDADQLFIEAVFLERDHQLAADSRHLTAFQAGLLARKARVRDLNVFHHSARYLNEPTALRHEAFWAFEQEAPL
ncbi:ribonuclease Z [Microvirga subterranea]|uniref:Ribonuclease Z n=1 Tax=Microvirga subterranea TaxID=186651 RepID=A0A370HMJ8_9HYPH|nr:ribonuclease Z [Microvirga subterranea]RDI59792.1 ribonuclease Z [Microvirga subterranea]